ncbi:hypothetical protein DS745_00470 [Anaerobacillus alkaliphilus]|uniref:Helicase Helix-turn-helix domain-containing protein n=1 Tax=Anaerobacillus alkaliphilus TaxID=1548597 RepID=A0A4Q0VZ57_9BACI|nr:helix-turn-helix domain-containing protein [Anaerobacillus alkaliphilus]RXJ03901.1 hypothetical protein DS745_00470 [Anaerobacillus alkaliphilus]
MEFLQVIFLLMLKNFDGSRTIFGAYHILNGKKTAQTIQDCRLFQLTHFFGVYKELDRDVVLEAMKQLVEKKFIRPCGENRFLITREGEAYLEEKLEDQPISPHLNGFLYKDVDEIFWTRLVLLSQCLSHLKVEKMHFIPVIKDTRIQLWVKDKLRNGNFNVEELASNLYLELKTLLQYFTNEEATIFVLRLSGVHRVGLTIDQIARELQLERAYVKIIFKGVIHGILDIVNKDIELYPILSGIFERVGDINVLTETTQKTYKLLQKGLSLEEISSVRMLKQSTVEDHVVEVALNVKDFPIDRFVSPGKQEAILEIVKRLGTKRLKEIKKECNEATSYFDIRLTIAKSEV